MAKYQSKHGIDVAERAQPGRPNFDHTKGNRVLVNFMQNARGQCTHEVGAKGPPKGNPLCVLILLNVIVTWHTRAQTGKVF